MKSVDDHATVDQLLPWYANGSLDAKTRHRIATHLQCCKACREELKFLGEVRKVMRHSVANEHPAPHALAGGFDSLPAELRQRLAPDARQAERPATRRIVPAVAAALFAAVGIGAMLTVSQVDEPRFRTATSVAAGTGEHVRVVVRFTPETRLQRVNELLREHRAVIAQGPDELDRWVLELPVSDDMSQQELLLALKRLHGVQEVRLIGEPHETR